MERELIGYMCEHADGEDVIPADEFMTGNLRKIQQILENQGYRYITAVYEVWA